MHPARMETSCPQLKGRETSNNKTNNNLRPYSPVDESRMLQTLLRLRTIAGAARIVPEREPQPTSTFAISAKKGFSAVLDVAAKNKATSCKEEPVMKRGLIVSEPLLQLKPAKLALMSSQISTRWQPSCSHSKMRVTLSSTVQASISYPLKRSFLTPSKKLAMLGT